MIETHCKKSNKPRATKKEIAMLSRLNELHAIFKERRSNAVSKDKDILYLKWTFKTLKVVHRLKKNYDWCDEMFCENGLVGLRNVNGDVLVPCGDYDFIQGCDYWDNTSLALASRNGLCGLVKRDGKGTVATPFKYLNFRRWDYDTGLVAKKYNIHTGYREANCDVCDLIVDGEVLASGVEHVEFDLGLISFWDEEKKKFGLLGIYWGWIFIEPIYDGIFLNDDQPYFTFLLNGEEGVLTTDKEFIPIEKWDSMTEEEQENLSEDVVGCSIFDLECPPILVTE